MKIENWTRCAQGVRLDYLSSVTDQKAAPADHPLYKEDIIMRGRFRLALVTVDDPSPDPRLDIQAGDVLCYFGALPAMVYRQEESHDYN